MDKTDGIKVMRDIYGDIVCGTDCKNDFGKCKKAKTKGQQRVPGKQCPYNILKAKIEAMEGPHD